MESQTTQPSQNKPVRRIGSFTFGVFLILTGILFLLRIFGNFISYRLIFGLWPVIFILLGGEVLFSCRKEPARYIYDMASVLLMIALCLFAVIMGCIDVGMQHAVWNLSL